MCKLIIINHVTLYQILPAHVYMIFWWWNGVVSDSFENSSAFRCYQI